MILSWHERILVGGGGSRFTGHKKALSTFFVCGFYSSTYFPEVQWFMTKKTIIFEGSGGGAPFSRRDLLFQGGGGGGKIAFFLYNPV